MEERKESEGGGDEEEWMQRRGTEGKGGEEEWIEREWGVQHKV